MNHFFIFLYFCLINELITPLIAFFFISEEQVSSLDCFQRCEILSSNRATVVRHFQYQVEAFLWEIILISSRAFSYVKYIAVPVEFQVRASPHIHIFILGVRSTKY